MKKDKEKKLTFTPGEYDRLVLDLDLIVSSLHVAFDHDQDVFDLTPIVDEALNRALGVKSLIGDMSPQWT